MNKIEELLKHVGWNQVSDIHALDAECGDAPSKGNSLALQLLENAQNQTGISVDSKEQKEILSKIKSLYC